MSMVTDIRRNRSGIEIDLDGSLFLRLRRNSFEAFPLAVGEELDPDAYRSALAAYQLPFAREAALSALDVQDKTASAMRRFLVYKGFLPEVADAIVESLRSKRLIDDKQYAARFVESHANRPQGRYAFRRTLQAKGVDRDTAEAATEMLDNDRERAAALEAARKLAHRYADDAPRDARRKLGQALARRGFSWDDIAAVLDAQMPDANDWDN